MSQTLEERPLSTAITEYQPVAAGLAVLRHRLGDVVFDCRTPAGDRQAREARRELVTLRTSLEARRVELKAPALERSRLIDAEAKRIADAVRAIEEPIDLQIKAVEHEKEAERQRKVRAEAERIVGIRSAIGAAFALPAGKRSAAEVTAIRDAWTTVDCAQFSDLVGEAEATRERAIAAANEAIAELTQREAEASELERQRAELTEQRRKDAAERAEREAKDAEARAAEEQRQRAERATESQRLTEERARIDAANADLLRRQAEVERRESERVAAEQAESRRRVEEEHARLQEEAARRDRVARAAPAMLASLLEWAELDQQHTEQSHHVWRNGRARRDAAIAAAAGA